MAARRGSTKDKRQAGPARAKKKEKTADGEVRWLSPAEQETWRAFLAGQVLTLRCCGNLFDKTPFAYRQAITWSRRREQFVKRAGFSLMAALAVHDKLADDTKFLRFLPLIKRAATDERNFVKKAVNWALRQIGKRNRRLNAAARETAREIQRFESRAARWVAADALRELTSPALQTRRRGARLASQGLGLHDHGQMRLAAVDTGQSARL